MHFFPCLRHEYSIAPTAGNFLRRLNTTDKVEMLYINEFAYLEVEFKLITKQLRY